MNRSTLLCIVILGFSSSIFAQFYVQHDAVLHLKSQKSTLSVQEAQLQVNAPLSGQGTLLLNRSSFQTLESTQNSLELPNLTIEHAHLVQLNSALRLEQQLTLHSGVLHLEQPLYLTDQTALVLHNNSSIQSKEFLVYDHQITNHKQPLLVWSHSPISNYFCQTYEGLSFSEFPTPQKTNFRRLSQSYITLFLTSKTPPPEANA